ncbi:DUF4296 domain-containing protein [Daejeonella sp.]|uniref:DUF4296 domain-containing protein n=1 Tax=Daejeonella sp. TaxID=2805397 RepID=UPI00398361A1
MKQLQLFIIPLLLVAACNKNQVPDGVLEEQRMVNLLADITIIDGYISTLTYTDTLKIDRKNYYATVYKNHNINKEVFDKSMKYYSTQPALLDSMYNKVNRKLEAKERVLTKIEQRKMLKKANSK